MLKSACNSEVKDLAIDWAELAFDSMLDEGVLKDAPILGSIVKICMVSKTIRDKLFVRKVWDFLRACPEFTEAEKDTFTRKHLNDSNEAQRLGDAIVLILDKLDDLEKPAMLAKVFAAFVRGHITRDAFGRLSAGINSGYIQDLKALAGQPVVPEEMAERYPMGLVRCGFAELEPNDGLAIADFRAYVNDLGKLFQTCILNDF